MINDQKRAQRFDCVVQKVTKIQEKEGKEYQLLKVKRNIYREDILYVNDDFLLTRVHFAQRYSRLYVVGCESTFGKQKVILVEMVTLTKQ